VQSFLIKEMGKEWVEKCEQSLYLAKRLGNIYTGSLYNGLLSLICDQAISLQGKTILMFSYGSGCAASMFVLRVTGDYSRIKKAAQFKTRLTNRVRISAEEFDSMMTHREQMFGKCNYVPTVSF
jgi:hydroxymethylglutaryl-CoA synthase